MDKQPAHIREVRFNAPWGWIAIAHRDGKLFSVDLDSACRADNEAEWNDADRRVARSFRRYLDLPGRIDLPTVLEGTPFQLQVWRALTEIPAGQVKTYGQLAQELHSGARAVANACRANPLPIIVPCHRVVAANGLGGFMGEISGRPVHIKQWLLRHEGGG